MVNFGLHLTEPWTQMLNHDKHPNLHYAKIFSFQQFHKNFPLQPPALPVKLIS